MFAECRRRRCAALRNRCGRLRCVSNAELSFVRAKLVLTRTKLATRGTANSKEHEVQVTATRRGGRGEGLRYCWPQDKPVRRAGENFPSEKPNEHESN